MIAELLVVFIMLAVFLAKNNFSNWFSLSVCRFSFVLTLLYSSPVCLTEMIGDVHGGLNRIILRSLAIPPDRAVCTCGLAFVSVNFLRGVDFLLLIGSRLFRKIDVHIRPRVGRDNHFRPSFVGHSS